MATSKTLLLIGPTGAGKSTTCNLIYNQSSVESLLKGPFMSSDDLNSCTNKFQIQITHEYQLIDTIGFSKIECISTVFNDIKKAYEKAKKIDYVLFVFKKDRLNEISEFLFSSEFQENFIKKYLYKPILILTNCDNGWVDKQKSKNELFQKILENFNQRYIELNLLSFSSEDDDDDFKKMLLDKRQKQVNQFLDKLAVLTLGDTNNSSDVFSSIENSRKKLKIKDPYQNDIKLNHFIDIKMPNLFDDLLIDLSQYEERLRTRELAICIARCWYIVRNNFNLGDKQYLKCTINNENQHDNIYIGDEQSMKTPVNIIISFMISLAYSRIAIMLVRNHGGSNQIFKCSNYKFEVNIDGSIQYESFYDSFQKIMNSKYNSEWEMLNDEEKNIFNIDIMSVKSMKRNIKKNTIKEYSKMVKPIVLIGNTNRDFMKSTDTFLEKLNIKEHKIKPDCNFLKYGLLIDEADEPIITFKKNEGSTENSIYFEKRKSLNNSSFWESSSFNFSTTATFFDLIYCGTENINRRANYIIKDVPVNYHGFSSELIDTYRIKIKSLDINFETSDDSDINDSDKKSNDDLEFLDECNRIGVKKFLLEQIPRRYNEQDYLSVLFNLGKLSNNENQNDFMHYIMKLIPIATNMLCFKFNQMKKQVFLIKIAKNDENENKIKQCIIDSNKNQLEGSYGPELVYKSDKYYQIEYVFKSETKKNKQKDYIKISNLYNTAFKLAKMFFNDKFAIFCVCGLLAKRCFTFKGDLDDECKRPLTDMYYSPTLKPDGKPNSTFTYQHKQTFSRLAGVDSLINIERILWVPNKIVESEVQRSINFYEELKKLVNDKPNQVWNELTKSLNHDHLNIIKSFNKRIKNITKTGIMAKENEEKTQIPEEFKNSRYSNKENGNDEDDNNSVEDEYADKDEDEDDDTNRILDANKILIKKSLEILRLSKKKREFSEIEIIECLKQEFQLKDKEHIRKQSNNKEKQQIFYLTGEDIEVEVKKSIQNTLNSKLIKKDKGLYYL